MCDFEDLKKIIPNITDFEKEIRAYGAPIICPNLEDPLLTQFGGGTFVKIENYYGILTAGHVAMIFINKSIKTLYLPIGEEIVPLKFEEIIQLPHEDGWRSIDLAFIRLAKPDDVLNLGYKFYDLSSEKNKVLNNYEDKIKNGKCCAFLATPSEGKKSIKLPNKTLVEYPYSAFSFGGIKENSYESAPFYFSDLKLPQSIRELEFRLDEFKHEITAKKGMPQSHKGSSGNSYWHAEIVWIEKEAFCQKPELLGVLVEQKNNILIIRGGISLYETFLIFCATYLATGDFNEALKTASVEIKKS